jgi:hypothetical protein
MPKMPLDLPTVDQGDSSMKKKQMLVAVRVLLAPDAAGETIIPVDGRSLADLMADWRIVQIEPLEARAIEGYAALLLLEEDRGPGSSGRLGFDL